MEVKLIEVRDRGTLVPCIAIKLVQRSPQEVALLRRAGYAEDQIAPEWNDEPYILFASLMGGKMEYDPYSQDNRTYFTAHMHCITHWGSLTSGSVIDVEYVKGEVDTPKRSELR